MEDFLEVSSFEVMVVVVVIRKLLKVLKLDRVLVIAATYKLMGLSKIGFISFGRELKEAS